MSTPVLQIDTQNGIRTVTINRPDKLNAVSYTHLDVYKRQGLRCAILRAGHRSDSRGLSACGTLRQHHIHKMQAQVVMHHRPRRNFIATAMAATA